MMDVASMDQCELETRSIEVASWQIKRPKQRPKQRSSHNGRSALAAPHSAKVFCPISRGLPKVPHNKAGVENQAEKLEMLEMK